MKIRATWIMAGCLLMFALSACRSTTGLNATQRVEQLNRIAWMCGNWLWEGGDDRMIEMWQRQNDTLYAGRSFFLLQGDTVFSENIRIQPGKRHLYYNVEMETDGKKKSHSFIITKISRNAFIAEDPQNEDLNRITYTGKSGVQITIVTRGLEDGRMVNEEYKMRRIARPDER